MRSRRGIYARRFSPSRAACPLSPPDGQTRIATEHRILPPGQASLEIGTTLPSRTLLHMCGGGVARWPYGSETVRLLVNLEDPWSHLVAEQWEMRQRAEQETLW